ncbi:SOS response-associated peptidase [Sphingobium amiense]|uniref:Abasic site processing protein n=1 Tax=Sphingobium amiense TaxID=135719 RepID=A0A494W2W6_9SPHN|nr:SOS response-associated peptidase [Sphingobium amiense]BBD96957.1 SOS response-associated peptidase [Sphingobium amiense]
MCNDYRLEVEIASIMEDFEGLEINIDVPEGTPNVAARADINITDTAPIVRGIEGRRGGGELINRRWSWPGQGGKPVYNFRAEGREFTSNRVLILTDGFYEFTDPQPGEKRKTKWLFTLKDHDWFCIAGIWRAHPEIGEAFTMLTLEPGEDIAPFHRRQIVPLPRELWTDWLDASVPAGEVLRTLPKGSLIPAQVYPPQSALF